MKKFYVFLLAILSVWMPLAAQQIQWDNRQPQPQRGSMPAALPLESSTTQCGMDTLNYAWAKSSQLRLLSVNSATSAAGLCQYYDAPGEINIHGLTFYSYAPSAPNPVPVRVSIYKASSDSLPTGTPLFVDTVLVDSMYNGGSLPALAKKVAFPNPITVNFPYLVTIENPNSQNISVVTNDYDTLFLGPDGNFEWLSSAKFAQPPPNGTWERSYSVNVGGIPFNADVLLDPWVSYEIRSLYVADSTCFSSTPALVNFDGHPSDVVMNRMYNSLIIANQSNLILRYDFGDASPFVYARDTSHSYATAGPFTSTFTIVMNGFYNFCNDVFSVPIGGPGFPTAVYLHTTLGFTADFTDYSSGATGWSWDFGDGATGNTQNPSHTYAANGNYVVRLIADNSCGVDTFIDTVVINCTEQPVTAGFSPTQSGFMVSFSNTSTNGTSFTWDFGDGSTGTQANPSHIYANTGTYIVTLIAKNLCYADTIVDTVFAGVIGLDPGNEQAFLLWPNPAQDEVKLKMEGGAFDLELLDLNGRILLRKENNPAGTELPVSLEKLSPGIYVVRVISGDKVLTGKLRKD